MFGLIDGNSFYCSCQWAFDPKLRGKLLVVLSNMTGALSPGRRSLGREDGRAVAPAQLRTLPGWS